MTSPNPPPAAASTGGRPGKVKEIVPMYVGGAGEEGVMSVSDRCVRMRRAPRLGDARKAR
jgi:hypothetical protein